ncbi:hypothetical protein CYMTET_24500 [Cymbomonas tetramitiformis]|uniref:Uncharacterized protein n=1 Tax=Cymbomonas tetramitiformis TaxID=36881 RepID=A0AAE0FVQ6_9CHLO|nr:hypothetical protein CYMTET_24500 [Cymbomonas tetramitiformis]
MPHGKTIALSVLYALLQATCCTAFPPEGTALDYTEFLGPSCGQEISAHKQVANLECFPVECSDFSPENAPPACVIDSDTKFYQRATCLEAFESDCSQVGRDLEESDYGSSSTSSICNLVPVVEFFTQAGCDEDYLIYTWKGAPAGQDIASVDLDLVSCNPIKDHHVEFDRFDQENTFKEFSIKATCVLSLSPPPQESFFDFLVPSSRGSTYDGLYAIAVICGVGTMVVAFMLYTKRGLVSTAGQYVSASV